MTSLEQLICQRDILQVGKFSFLTGETHFTQKCVRRDSGHLQIQQGWPQSPEAHPAVLWYLCERKEQEMGGGAKNWSGAARWLGHTSQRRGARIGVS